MEASSADELLSVCRRPDIPLDEIKRLVKQNPKNLRKCDKNGLLPLHLACRYCKRQFGEPNTRSFDVIQFLLHQYRPDDQYSALHSSLALKFACLYSQPQPVVQILVNHFPDSISQPDARHKRLPLHWAVTGTLPSMEMVHFLINIYPNALSVPDAYGRLPLHCLVGRGRKDRCRAGASERLFELVHTLVQAYPSATQKVDKNGQLPLHVACYGKGRHVSTELLKYLVEVSPPDAVSMADQRGMVPLHIVCQRTLWRCQENDVRYLINRAPETIFVADNEGRTPRDGANLDATRVFEARRRANQAVKRRFLRTVVRELVLRFELPHEVGERIMDYCRIN